MLGRLLNTLSYRLGCELREWHKSNQTVRDNPWPWYQRALITAGKNPVWVPVGIFWIVLLSSAMMWGYHAYFAPATFGPPSPALRLEQHFFTLWTVQATIAAMIYPIVIGFMTLLLQRRHSAKASLQIYLHDSAAILTGLSALFLVMAMAIQCFFIDMIGKQVLACWLFLDGLWFLINVAGVIRFLHRTFDYLRPEQRAIIQRAYAINHVWPAEMRRNLEYNRFHGAIDCGWLPGPGFADDENNSNTAILLGLSGRHVGDVQVTDDKKDKWYIHDVRFNLLTRAVLSWQKREEKLALSKNVQQNSFAGLGHSRTLVLPYAPGTQFDAAYGLCRSEGSTGLCWWEKLLVRWSFVLAPTEKKTATLSISDILNGLVTEAQIAIEVSEEVTFREALEELVSMHAALLQAGNFVTGKGQRENYAYLENRDHVLESRMYVSWVREYNRLLKTTVEKLQVGDAYFKHIVHVPGWLIDELKDVRPITIPCYFLRLSMSMHLRLNRWWSRTLEEQGLLGHGPCEPETLKAPAVAIYDDALREYVGAWEALKNDRFPPTGSETMTWEQYGEISELYTEHLDSTVYMLFDSLILGNKDGSEWLCDSLIKWWDTMSLRFDNSRGYIHDESKLTMELMDKPWEAARSTVDLSMLSVDEDNAPKVLWAACIYNYWIDLCCISLYTLIQFGKTCECESSLPAQLAGNLGKGKALRAGGKSIGSHWPIQALEDLLISIIRQYYLDGGYHRGYRARFDWVVEAIFDRRKPAIVPGRVYSGSGAEDLDALRDGQLVLLCLLIKQDWTPSDQFMVQVRKWGAYDTAGLSKFVTQLKQWRSRLNDVDFREYNQLFLCVQGKFDAVENLVVAATSLNLGLGQMIDGIEGFRDEQLREAQISEERLREVARWSSRSGFSQDDGDIPISLFREVQHSEVEYTEFSQPFSDLNKGEYVEPPMAQRASNEDEYFDRVISRSVAMNVMAETLKSLNPTTVDVESPVAYWEQIQFAASRIRKGGETPILLVAGRGEPRWLLDWTRSNYDEDIRRPEGIRLVRDKKVELDGYVGSLNDIPLFVAPIAIGSSYLISREALDTLKFTEFEDGVFVKVSAEPVQGKDMLINLRLVWRFHPELKPSKCWQLRYIKRNS